MNITKQLVDLMNGTISVDSIYKRGSVFTVSLKQGIIDETPIGDMMQNIHHNSQTGEKYQQLFDSKEEQEKIRAKKDAIKNKEKDDANKLIAECKLRPLFFHPVVEKEEEDNNKKSKNCRGRLRASAYKQ